MSPSRAPPRGAPWEPIDDMRPRQPPHTARPTQQEMDIFEQQEMSKSRLQVKSKLNKWYNWLINHVPKPIKDGASRAFKTFKNKIMGLYNRVTGSADNQALEGPCSAETQQNTEPKPFKSIELEQAFNGLTKAIGLMEDPR